ncbi:protein IQ-DOMAIN 32-like [Bidens hawaiensis]|uniref:protein IQ-DOMAIN 32-like n=1 Tax=Bidens hawaiensis TaxID=980011 RepID=UPI004048F7CB
MQALVRARHTNVSLGKTSTRKKVNVYSRTVPHPTYISIEKLLSNRFAIQLLESTPRTKQINIKCDPSIDDPSWKWLERWTSVSSPQLRDPHEPKQVQDKVIDTKNQTENIVSEQKSDNLSDESTHSNNGPGLGPEKPNPPSKRAAFIAVQSRFEELTSNNKSLTSMNSANQKHGSAGKSQSVDPVGPPVYESLKLGHSRTGGSECGTELSVTSMLDSPDPSEAGNIESYKESKLDELTHSVSNLSETYDYNASTEHIELEPETGRQMKSSMHKESESPVRPSSQISNNKNAKKVPTKPKAWSNSTKSTVSSNHGLGLRNSLDHLPLESKPANRRNSFGSQSSEPVVDQEPRDSCSSNSIPSYMQITESAKAKALVNNSPRSSPDVHGKEGYLKKRHSLPGSVSGRHGSPRVRRSPQQTTKGYNNPERKWQN